MKKKHLGMELIATALVLWLCPLSWSQGLPQSNEGDYVAHDFHFRSGEVLPELRLHYYSAGQPARDAQGHVTSAVMIVHPTISEGGWHLRYKGFADELFGPGQLLDANRYYIISPDAIATANRVSQVMACTPDSRTTITTIWSRRSTCSLRNT